MVHFHIVLIFILFVNVLDSSSVEGSSNNIYLSDILRSSFRNFIQQFRLFVFYTSFKYNPWKNRQFKTINTFSFREKKNKRIQLFKETLIWLPFNLTVKWFQIRMILLKLSMREDMGWALPMISQITLFERSLNEMGLLLLYCFIYFF